MFHGHNEMHWTAARLRAERMCKASVGHRVAAAKKQRRTSEKSTLETRHAGAMQVDLEVRVGSCT